VGTVFLLTSFAVKLSVQAPHVNVPLQLEIVVSPHWETSRVVGDVPPAPVRVVQEHESTVLPPEPYVQLEHDPRKESPI
jgi:hypothetical protein